MPSGVYNSPNRTGGPKLKYTDEYINKLASELAIWIAQPQNFWLGCFAVEHGMDIKQLERFVVKNENFAYVYATAKQQQANKLILGGLLGKLNPFLVHCALKNVAGWRNDPEFTVDNSQHFHFSSMTNVQLIDEAKKRNIPLPIEIEKRLIEKNENKSPSICGGEFEDFPKFRKNC